MKFADAMQSADWKIEKHAPVIDSPDSVQAGEKFSVGVCVGKEIAHPNTTEHHIRWIKLYFKPDNSKFAVEIGDFQFNAHGESAEGPNKGPIYTEPFGQITIKLSTTGTLLASSYCNIHGLWESSKVISVTA